MWYVFEEKNFCEILLDMADNINTDIRTAE